MKRLKLISTAAVAIGLSAAAFNLSGCSSNQTDHTTQTSDVPSAPQAKSVKYTCPMHPEVVSDKPGDCPKCGMKLVEKK